MTAEMDEFRDWLAPRLAAVAGERDLLQIDHTVQVTSFGGSGTTALCDHLLDLGADLQKGPAQWPFKHRRQPPTPDEVPDGFRVIYIVSDPRDAIVSIFRRNYQVGHWSALNEAEPDEGTLARLADLDTFLDRGHDEFELTDHFTRWRAHDPGYPVMFLRYDHLGERWSEVAEFAGLAPTLPALEIRARNSDWRSLPQPRRQQLDTLYGELAASIDALPPLEIT